MSSYAYKDGEMIEIPEMVVSEDTEIHEPVNNTLVLRPGVNVTTLAAVNGTVRVMAGAALQARGPVSGALSVESRARALIHDRASGTIKIDRGAVFIFFRRRLRSESSVSMGL